ncbi:unnamed protein product [Caenorhabditis angaria]|uniref:Uncharacterized protein n=1 Tax=Caenorhabditis angaria TaxID=860376 RepID=A0A9P1IGZ9_9PELO|nr:unnamed protein product [Caenorhabditis angaria]
MSRRSRSRSRTRSPPSRPRDREDRRRRDDRDRKKDRKKRRHRSHSSEGSIAESHQLGSILKEERRRRERSRERNSTPRTFEPDASIPFDINTLNDSAKKWLEERITEQVTSRVDKLETLMAEKATAARNEMEKMLRAQIETEMANELEECKKRDEQSRKRCKQLESELEKKINEAEESRRQYEENRLAMLDQKSQLERERAELLREKEELKKSEQQTIINKGGVARAPIKFKFGK